MAKQWIRVLKGKRGISAIISLLLMLGVIHFYQQNLLEHKRVMVLNEGIQTCFIRTTQTYTAKLLGDLNSAYLRPDFMVTTEECFGETLALMEENFEKILVLEIKKLNNLSQDVHWFHQQIDGVSSTFSKSSKPDQEVLGERFSKLEDLRDQIVEGHMAHLERLAKSLASLKITLILLSILVPFLVLLEYREKKKRQAFNSAMEDEASFELSTKEIPQSSRVEYVLGKALRGNDLFQCSELFMKYHTAVLDGKLDALIRPVLSDGHKGRMTHQFLTPKEFKKADYLYTDSSAHQVSSIQVNDRKDQIIHRTLKPVEAEENSGVDHLIQLDSVLVDVVEILSAKIFNRGIILDLQIDENIEVELDSDGIQQVFFAVINNAIQSCHDIIGEKTITVKLKKLGGSALFELCDTGIGFAPDFIKWKMGLTSYKHFIESTDLVICDELAKDLGIELSYENVIANDSSISGGKVRMIFRLTQKRAVVNGLINVRKSTKNDLVEEFRAQGFAV